MIPGWGRSLGEENGYPLQYYGLKNSMDCIVHGVSKSWIRLSNFHFQLLYSICCISSVVSNSFQPHGLHSPWNSPGQNAGVDNHSILQGIFPTQGSNPGLRHCRRIRYQLSHKGNLRILEWVAYPFSSRSSRPRNLTRVSCIAGRFFTS